MLATLQPASPIICFDERPSFLIGEAVAPLSPQPGSLAKEHYPCTKNDSYSLLAAIEALTGMRLAHLQQQRTKREYALVLKTLSDKYPHAQPIHLNAHKKLLDDEEMLTTGS